MTQSIGKKVGMYTKYQRSKRNISLQKLSHSSGVDPSYLSRLERGDYIAPSIDVLTKLANGFNMSLIDLLTKCQILQKGVVLPSIEHYLKEKFYFPDSAIKDTLMFVSFLQKKYSLDIRRNKKLHQDYWNKIVENEELDTIINGSIKQNRKTSTSTS